MDDYDEDGHAGPVRGRPFRKGHSGNPKGRPPGAAGLAKYIREQTSDFREMADIALRIARGRQKFEDFVGPQAIQIKRRPSPAERLAAVKWLTDRGAGTAQAFIEVTGAGGGPLSISLKDLANLPDGDLEQLERIFQGADATGSGDGEGGEDEEGGGEAED